MPPSPALRCSPGRELTGKKHRRGHSIEYGILFKDKEDDLALFSDMQEKERDSFLLQSSDDLEDAFSTKLKHFSEFTIPVQGESSRLLFAADGDKNDYDWLLTPPDTPLFPSLDDEPPSVSIGSRGRPRSQISLSRSSTLEKSRRSSKGSASPNRLSMSPQADSMHQIRGRPSSAKHPSAASGRRSATPVRRASPTPGKPSGPISRSSTPTSRRMSTGSTTMASPAIRGTSPVRSSRGNSASPKLKVWQSNIPVFSLDAPPNLRTSLDHPASYVRGSSPASWNGRDAASTHSRQSVSPSASRSVSSSHSHERDRFSSHSKGSVASSGDDDFQSLQSVSVVGSEHAVSKRASLSPNNRTSRSSKLLSPSSAPRRPFESALRQMDHRKSHHTMFRPLASSLPSTGIYSGKGASSYHHIMLRHSSATVGSNSISGQVTGFTPDTIESDPIPVSETEVEKLAYPNKHGETTTFTMVDLLNESRHESPFSDQLGDMDKGNAIECESSVSEVNNHVFDAENSSTKGSLHVNDDYFERAALESMEVCDRCGCHYHVTKGTRSEINICPDCSDEQNFAETVVPEITRALEENSPEQAKRNLDENKSLVKMNLGTNVLELLPDDMAEAEIVEKRENAEQWVNSYEQRLIHLDESSVSKALEEEDVEMRNHQDKIQSSSGCDLSSICTKGTQAQFPGHHHDVKIDSSEVRDVALLIKRSSSIKSPIIQANYSSGFIRSYDGLSFSRDRSFSLRSSTETASASSSCDYGSSIRKGSHIRQQSGSIPDIEAHRYDINPKSLSSMSSSSGVSSHACQALNVMPEDNFEVFPDHMTYTYDETHQEFQPEQQDLQPRKTEVINADIGESSGSIGISTMESSINVVGVLAEYNSVIVGNGYYENEDDVANLVMSKMEIGESTVHVRSTSELEASPVTDDCFLDAQSMVQEKDGPETPPRGSSTTTSDIETESCEHEILGSGFHDELPESECNPNAVDDCSDLRSVENSMAHGDSDQHNSLTPPVNEILDEATVLVECPSGKETKSLTLEEATDAILFCSSIVHDLTYQAATLAIDKANDVQSQEYDEALHPTLTVLGKSNANRGYGRRGAKANQSSKSGKASRKQMETDEKRALQIENDENASEAVISRNVGVAPTSKGEILKQPPKLESKCNCSIM